MEIMYNVLGALMDWCYGLLHNYGAAIILFTLLTKIILLPLTVWTYYNSITMIKIQPDLNFLKAKYYGQRDVIAEEESKLYKEKGYHPLASTIPLIIQLVLLVGVVGTIRRGINDPSIDMMFLGINLGQVPAECGLKLIWSPIAAALSSWILSVTQNADNVLQAEQSNWNKYGTMALTVGLSLYLGWFVPVGTALYWICSNLMSVVIMYLMNWVIKPRQYVDYDRLEESRKALATLKSVGKKGKDLSREDKRREKADYKKFFSVVNKHLVFYSESSGFYKYYRGTIEYLLQHTNIVIHYITSDPSDQIFEIAKNEPQIRPYYIGENRLITLMMKMDADIVVMTMPDIENYHIKRSYIRKDIEYIYVPHGMGSNNLTLRKGSTDHYDTIFFSGRRQKQETEETERVYGLPAKKLVEVGYPLLDDLRKTYREAERPKHERPLVMIAPSWQADNIVDSCLDRLLDELRGGEYDIIVRPHPQEVRLKEAYMEELKRKYEGTGIVIQTDFSSNSPILEADLMITDWSDIGMEYAFTSYRPVLYINTPMKVMNPDWKDIDIEPINISIRKQIGRDLDLDQIGHVREVVDELLKDKELYADRIEKAAREDMYNLDGSAKVGADYIIMSLQEKVSRKG